MVKDLLNNQGEWDITKVNSTTFSYESDSLNRIHLSGIDREDKRYWLPEKKGHYTVKSGYWRLYEKVFLKQNPETPSTSEFDESTWKAIWDLHIPPKVKIFIWKATHGAIATEANLSKHHVPISPTCALCGYHWADMAHVLFFCWEAKKSWRYTGWWQKIKKHAQNNFLEILLFMKESCSRDDWEAFCVKSWGVWKDQCTNIHDKNNYDLRITRSTNWTDYFIQAFRKAKDAQKKQTRNTNINYSVSTEEDQEASHTLYTDAAFNSITGHFATGFVIKDHELNKIAEGGSKIKSPGTVLNAETQAIIQGLQA